MKAQELPNIPIDLRAEGDVIAGCLSNPKILSTAAERLTPTDFFNQAYQKIFSRTLEIASQGREVTDWALREALAGDADFQNSDGPALLSQCALNIPSVASAADACRVMKNLSMRRNLQHVLMCATQRVQDHTVSTANVIEETGTQFDAIRDGYLSSTRGVMHISEFVRELGPVLDRISSRRGLMFGVPTGFASLDFIMPGWGPGEMAILGARPSAGKSALGLEFALRQAEEGNAVAFYSLEMSAESVLLRLACRKAHVDYQRCASGTLSEEAFSALLDGLNRVSQLPLWLDARHDMKAKELRWRIVSLAKREKIRLAIVDYLQLVRADGENRTAQVTAISLELKAAARDLGEVSQGTLLAISQLNRIAVGEPPQLHHLRESGQLEQDADVVLFLYDEKQTEQSEGFRKEPPRKVLEVKKQRNGPQDKVQLRFLAPCMGFEEL